MRLGVNIKYLQVAKKCNLPYLIISVFFFFSFLICGLYLYYTYRLPRPHDYSETYKYYSKDFVLKRAGGHVFFPHHKFQHFLNFNPLKGKDTIRIGAFGDSFTAGQEVDKTESYPYQLQQLFKKYLPSKKIEVLNFGVNGDGFQDQFFFWEEYAKAYGLDYILFGPKGFYSERDLRFVVHWGSRHFGYPKERFVLSKDNQLKRIHIKGDTPEERYKNYYTPIPSWTVLRYDRKPFFLWKYLFPSLRDMPSPFYYSNLSMDETSSKINKILLEKIRVQHNKKILFITDFEPTFKNYRSEQNLYNLNYIDFNGPYYYWMPGGHGSSLTNEFMANIFFYALMGRSDFTFDFINCDLTSHLSLPTIKKKPLQGKLFTVKSIQIMGANREFSSLVPTNAISRYDNKNVYGRSKTKDTKSFLSFSNHFPLGRHSSYWYHFPLSISLKEGMRIFIQVGGKKIKLGPIKSLDTHGVFFTFYKTYISIKGDLPGKFSLITHQILSSLGGELGPLENSMDLYVENYKLGELRPSSDGTFIHFYPKGIKEVFIMSGPASNHVRVGDFPSQFPLYIQYNMEKGENVKSLIPNVICKKEKRQINLKLPHFEPLNLTDISEKENIK